MTGRTSDHDSHALTELRLRFRQAYPRMTATPENLGKYARDTHTIIIDLGKHSNGWKDLFLRANRGHHPIRRYAPTFLASPPSPLDF